MEQLGVEINRQVTQRQSSSVKTLKEESQPEPDCGRCQDQKYIFVVRPEHPMGFRMFWPCFDCAKVYATSFESFDPVEGSKDGLEASRVFANGEGPEWLVLNGITGSGKTRLGKAVAAEITRQIKQVRMVYVPDMLESIKEGFDNGAHKDIRGELMSVETLILDDLGDGGRDDPQGEGIGRYATTPWAREEITRLLNYRYEQGMRTMITTNHDEDEIRRLYGRRLASRMFGIKQGFVAVVGLECGDYR